MEGAWIMFQGVITREDIREWFLSYCQNW